MADKEIYLLVEGPELLAVCRAWRERWIAAQTAAYDFAKALGSPGWFPDLEGNLHALVPIDPVPTGWTTPKPKRRSDHRKMVPVKGAEGDAARAAIAALPKAPSQREITRLIGHPENISYKCEDGYGSGMMGLRWHPTQLFWPKGEDPAMMIVCPDADAYVAECLEQNPGCTITQGRWTPPPGLRVISKARKDLIKAQAEVAAEAEAEAEAEKAA